MKKLFTTLASTLIFASAATFAGNAEKTEITFAGSSTIMPIMESLEPVFKDNGVKVAIQGGGSSAGIKAVRDGMADIGMVSRSLTKSEQKKYGNFAFAGDLIVIIAHKSNELNDVNDKIIKDIYSGKKTKWDNGKTITVIGKENGRATQVVFEQHFDLFGQITGKAVIIGANGQAIASVENDPGAIAYVSYNSAVASIEKGSDIKILSLNGVAPSTKSVQEGKYKLARDLNLVFDRENPAAINKIKQILKLTAADEVMTHHRVINYGKM